MSRRTFDTNLAYFFVAVLAGAAFAATLTGFIGAPQHMTSHAEQPQGFSTTMTTPQVPHSYLSPFLAKFSSPIIRFIRDKFKSFIPDKKAREVVYATTWHDLSRATYAFALIYQSPLGPLHSLLVLDSLIWARQRRVFSHSLPRLILEKLVLAVLAFSGFFLFASVFGILRQPAKDLVVWFQGEFDNLVFVLCFLAVVYVAFRVKMKQRSESGSSFGEG